MVERVDAGVFEVAVDDAANLDALTLVRHTLNQAADAPHDDLDRDARHRGVVEPPNDLGVLQRVHLEGHARGLSGLGGFRLRLYEPIESLPQSEGSHKEMLRLGLLDVAGKETEDLVQIVCDPRIRGEDPVIGVDPRGLLVEVPGADVAISNDGVALPSGYQGDLRVDLDALDGIEGANPRRFQPVRPIEVRLLIEPCLDLHEDRDLLPVLRGLDERRQDVGFLGHPVDGQAQLLHIGVFGGFVQEADEMAEGLIGRMKDLVPLLQKGQNRIGAPELRMRQRGPLRIRQVLPGETGEAHVIT
jgi:hypothetical protein